jgi:hypothetical protein
MDREGLVAAFARLGEVFVAVERQLEAIPTYRALPLTGDAWLYVTTGSLGAPAVVVYYEILASERVVWLRGAALNR